jgi:hypothetical protein
VFTSVVPVSEPGGTLALVGVAAVWSAAAARIRRRWEVGRRASPADPSGPADPAAREVPQSGTPGRPGGAFELRPEGSRMRRLSIALSLVVPWLLTPSPASAQDAGEVARLRREIELLRKENELLRKEVELLKKELALRPGAEKKAGPAKVTLNNVEYEFVHIKLDGVEATMRIAVTSKKGQVTIHGRGVRLLTADGREYQIPVINFGGKLTKTLPEDVRVLVDYPIGKLPAEFREFATIVLPNNTGSGFRADADNPVTLKGKFKVER